ncbi:hypothetical protein CK227_25090 [Mesorhizobium sp. WSM4308]|nr:hypothetical protein CK232_24275 [Mesorhizobium sp. WSM4304]PBB72924.1 hypothetical protein CK227_25090 [Mesorhizobium sp. WSM4308]
MLGELTAVPGPGRISFAPDYDLSFIGGNVGCGQQRVEPPSKRRMTGLTFGKAFGTQGAELGKAKAVLTFHAPIWEALGR